MGYASVHYLIANGDASLFVCCKQVIDNVYLIKTHLRDQFKFINNPFYIKIPDFFADHLPANTEDALIGASPGCNHIDG